MAKIWEMYFTGRKDCELYIKIALSPHRLMHFRPNVVFDSRNLELSELARLYHQAHAFVFPTFGEGFGLTVAEAMATGLPCIIPLYSGLADFCNTKNSYPIKYVMVDVDYGVETQAALVDPVDMARKMAEVMSNYHKAIIKGKRASRLIKEQFTWQRAAQKIVDIVQKYKDVAKIDTGFHDFYQGKMTPAYYFGERRARDPEIKALLPYNSILGVGSGRAIIEDYLAAAERKVVASDIDPRSAKRAMQTWKNLKTYIAADCKKLPFKNNSFEAVYSQGLLEHFEPQEVIQMVTEMRRVASKAVVFAVPLKGYSGPVFGKEYRRKSEEWVELLKDFSIKATEYEETLGKVGIFIVNEK